jgi:hypothetical protein
MRKIYRMDSDFTSLELDDINDNMPYETRELMESFAHSIEMVESYLKEDGTYNLIDGTDVMLCILDEWEKGKMFKLMNLVFDTNRYTIVDISEDVLFGKHSENDYIGAEDTMKPIFDMYLDMYLDQDTVLDKINKYGMASLNERDKKVLESVDI